jgi:protein-S-isoprenylcysteine O-methyltransferase Ste14
MLIGAGASYLAGWPRFPGLPLIWLGVALIVLGIALAGASVMLFRREGTEVNPTSPTNRKLVTSGPFRVTRNPMYLGLIIVTVGVAFGVGAWPMFLVPVALFATANWVHVPLRRRRCVASSAGRSTPMHKRSGGGFDGGFVRALRILYKEWLLLNN